MIPIRSTFHLLVVLLVVLALLPMSTSAFSQSPTQAGAIGLQTPSGNIHCQMFVLDKQATLRCDIAQMTTRPRRPADCDLEWGDAFEVAARAANATRICHGDTVMDKALPVLAYGDVWQRDGFSCTSEPTGLTCFNADRHGFSLSKATQTIF